MTDALEFYDGSNAGPLFKQLWSIIFEILDDTLSQMSDKEYASAVRDRIDHNMQRLRITMDANTRRFDFYLDVPGTVESWERIFSMVLDNPHVPPTTN